MKVDIQRLFQKVGNEEVPYYVFFRQGNITDPLFIMLPTDAKYLYDSLRSYFDVDLKGGGHAH